MYGWLGNSRQNYGAGATTLWTETNVSAADYATTAYGGPYVDLDGATEDLRIADATWQEPGAEEFLVWHWAYPTRAGTGPPGFQAIVGKTDAGGVGLSWILFRQIAGGLFEFRVGGGGAFAVATTTYPVVHNNWYFVAGYFVPSTLTRIFVGASGDNNLTIDDAPGASPAFLSDLPVPLIIGAYLSVGATTGWWQGYIGAGGARINTPSANINAYVRQLFGMTKEIYQ